MEVGMGCVFTEQDADAICRFIEGQPGCNPENAFACDGTGGHDPALALAKLYILSERPCPFGRVTFGVQGEQ